MTPKSPMHARLLLLPLSLLFFGCGDDEIARGPLADSTIEVDAAPLDASIAAPEDAAAPLSPRVALREGAGGRRELYVPRTGARFTPRGYNYTHVMPLTAPCLVTGATYHSTFNVGVYDAEEAEAMMGRLEGAGYNTVRVFLNPECMTDEAGTLAPAYLDNLVDFLERARAHGLVVIITLDQLPSTDYGAPIQREEDVWWQNAQYLYDAEIRIEEAFWADFIRALKAADAPLEALLAYELRNEMFFHPYRAPIDQASGSITTANGQTYDMADEAQKARMAHEAFIHWSGRVNAAIKAEDPEGLVMVGFFAPELFGAPARSALFDAEIDVVDLHMYPEEGVTLEDYARHFDLERVTEKPVIMGEYGVVEAPELPIEEAVERLTRWREGSCAYGVSGWLLWTWRTEEGLEMSIADRGGALFEALSPEAQAEICAP